jgi:hypothetical protein
MSGTVSPSAPHTSSTMLLVRLYSPRKLMVDDPSDSSALQFGCKVEMSTVSSS